MNTLIFSLIIPPFSKKDLFESYYITAKYYNQGKSACLGPRKGVFMTEQKIKQDKICIGANIKRIRKEKKIKQVYVVIQMQLMGLDMTRESLVKIERGTQHIYASQLRAIKEILGTTYDELLK